MAVKDYKTTADQNTSISGINIAEGCPPSGINNAIRQLMADVKAKTDAQDTATAAAKTAADNAKTAADGKLPLSGGTLTGTVLTSNSTTLRRTGTDGILQLGFQTLVNGGRLNLFGKDYSDASYAGGFSITTGNGTGTKDLKGKPDGTLTWDDKNITVEGDCLPLSGGTMTGTILSNAASTLRKSGTADLLQVGFETLANGARLNLFGNAYSEAAFKNAFQISTGAKGGGKGLIGSPDGSLTWNDVNVSAICLPSSSYTNLTLGATGTSYTAPGDGWVIVDKNASDAGQYLMVEAEGYEQTIYSSNGNNRLRMTFPVVKGRTFKISYSMGGTTNKFRFYKSQGQKLVG